MRRDILQHHLIDFNCYNRWHWRTRPSTWAPSPSQMGDPPPTTPTTPSTQPSQWTNGEVYILHSVLDKLLSACTHKVLLDVRLTKLVPLYTFVFSSLRLSCHSPHHPLKVSKYDPLIMEGDL